RDFHVTGVQTCALPILPLQRAGRNPFSDILAAIVLNRHLARIRPDVVLSYTIKPVVWGTLAAAVQRVPRRVAMVTGLGYSFSGEIGRASCRGGAGTSAR